MKIAIATFSILLLACSTWAIDPEGCLTCHQYRGLSRLDADGKKIEMFFVEPSLHAHASGPHARIHELLRAKYGLADRWVRFVGPDDETVCAVRLDPIGED